MVSSAKRMTMAALAAAAALGFAPASAGVVVSASGPSASGFPVGKKIGDSERIVLRAGDTLTVLDGKGTRVLRGAGTFALNQQAGADRSSAFAVLTERRSAQRVRTAAVRGDGVPGMAPPNLWYVDIGRPGKTCLADTERVRLWRGAAEGEATYAIRAGDAGQTVSFDDGAILASWDKQALPLAENTEYRISRTDDVEAGTLTFAILPSVAEDPEALAQQLIANGCTRQLELLSTAMMIES
jgi:hypothetical protein